MSHVRAKRPTPSGHGLTLTGLHHSALLHEWPITDLWCGFSRCHSSARSSRPFSVDPTIDDHREEQINKKYPIEEFAIFAVLPSVDLLVKITQAGCPRLPRRVICRAQPLTVDTICRYAPAILAPLYCEPWSVHDLFSPWQSQYRCSNASRTKPAPSRCHRPQCCHLAIPSRPNFSLIYPSNSPESYMITADE